MEKVDLSISLVTYKSKKDVLDETVWSVLNSEGILCRLYIIDNSPTDEIRSWYHDERIEYIFNNNNIGFGAAHNIIMRDTQKLGRYHLVLNPDIKFSSEVLKGLLEYMDKHEDVGNIIPKTFYPDGSLCPVCKLLPTPTDMFLRMIIPFKAWRMRLSRKYQMLFCDFNNIMNVPYLSGCFMFIRLSVLKTVGVFDEKMFMYAEDVDLSRRIHQKYKTIFYPKYSMIHRSAEESHRNIKLLRIHISSCVYYFNKWGWIFDNERRVINSKAIKENL